MYERETRGERKPWRRKGKIEINVVNEGDIKKKINDVVVNK